MAGLVGFAERGPLHTPVRITSWSEYLAVFGGFGAPGHLPYSVRLFFENGGPTLYIVRVAVPEDDHSIPELGRARKASGLLSFHLPLRPDNDADPFTCAMSVSATSPGRWANHVDIEVTPERMGRATIIVRDADRVWRLPEVAFDVTDRRFLGNLLKEHATVPVTSGVEPHHLTSESLSISQLAERLRTTVGELLAVNSELANRSTISADTRVVVPPEAARQMQVLPQTVRLRGGRDGIAHCTPDHMIGVSAIGAVSSSANGSSSGRWGVSSLLDVDEVSIIAVPDSVSAVAHVRQRTTPPKEPECSSPTSFTESSPNDDELRGTEWAIDPMRKGDPSLSHEWKPGTSPAIVVEELEKIAARHGLNLRELLAANPAYRPAERPPKTWSVPGIPIAIPAPPAETSPTWTRADTQYMTDGLIRFCETRQDCVALIDAPDSIQDVTEMMSYGRSFSSSVAALNWPWLVLRTGGRHGSVRTPTSGAVAGLTAARDLQAGPHHSPAGEPINGVVATALTLSDDDHARLNISGVNVLRERAAGGVMLEGARSLSSDGILRYFTVRRTLLVIRRAIEDQTQWAAFEFAVPAVWADLEDQIRAYLKHLWRRGWLSGAVPSEAFYVKCDEGTNPAEVQATGMIVALIGLRFPPPIEWIVVRIGRSSSAVEVFDVI